MDDLFLLESLERSERDCFARFSLKVNFRRLAYSLSGNKSNILLCHGLILSFPRRSQFDSLRLQKHVAEQSYNQSSVEPEGCFASGLSDGMV